ncbi:condensation domain-containing protein [Kitasatospora sp. NPDC097691]|uniref:condensation domain-containing protein n=1 Tax=Kitasatospora sp. NPDC097691 TaxID=3157231 RepID=UPI00331C2006
MSPDPHARPLSADPHARPLSADPQYRPLSAGQQMIWTAHRVAPQSSAYVIAVALRIRGELRTDALATAVDALVARHELLGSVVVEDAGRPRFAPAPDTGRVLRVEDLPDEGEEAFLAAVRDRCREGFAPAEEPMVRVTVLRRPGQEAALVLTAHHMISDYASQHVMLRELLEDHHALLATGGLPPRPAAFPYRTYVAEERGLPGTPAAERAEAHWRSVCEGSEPIGLALDRPRPAVPGYRGGTVELDLTEDEFAEVRERAALAGTIPFGYLLGLFQAALYRYTGRRDFLIGVPVSQRRRRADAVGYFASTVPLRAGFAPGTTVRDAVQSVGRQLGEARTHARHPVTPPLRVALTMITTDRQLPVLDHVPAGTPYGPEREYLGLRISRIGISQQEGQLDLVVRLEESGGALKAVFAYDGDLLDRATVQRIADYFGRLLDRAAADTRIDDIRLADRTDLADLLALGQG